jgi:uncharacterized protein
MRNFRLHSHASVRLAWGWMIASAKPMEASVTIVGVFVYPLKSTRGIARETARLVATGFEWDRQWMFVDAHGTFLSQRTHPQLARLVPEITSEALVVRAPGRPPLEVPLAAAADGGGQHIAVRVHRDRCVGIDQGHTAAQWASETLGEALRLVRVPQDPARRANPAFAGTTPAPMGFADGFPLLICNEASLADLNRRLPQPIPMERFRPNLVFSGLPAWAEDRIDSLTIGAVRLRLVKPCTRCTIPSIDQCSGMPATDPAPALREFRFNPALHGVTFGGNAVLDAGAGAAVRRGARCRVTLLG